MNTSIIATYPIVVFDYEKLDLNSLPLEQRIEAIRAKREKASKRLQTIMSRIARMSKIVLSRNKNQFDQIKELHAEISALEEERLAELRKQHSAEDDDDLENMFREAQQESYEHHRRVQEEEPEVPFSEKSMKVKKLFRKIAAKTHPDKTKNVEHHKLFLSARECYHNNDYEGLQRIWEILKGKVSKLFSQLLQVLQRELDDLAQVENQLNYLLNSDDYTLMELFERHQDTVLQEVAMKNRLHIQMLIQQRDTLKRALGKFTPPDTTWVTFQF